MFAVQNSILDIRYSIFFLQTLGTLVPRVSGERGYRIRIMPLHVKSIAVSIAVICFFGLSIIGWISGLSPFICCKRALAGAVIAYIAGTLVVRAVNAILISAMITNQMNRQKEKNSGAKD